MSDGKGYDVRVVIRVSLGLFFALGDILLCCGVSISYMRLDRCARGTGIKNRK